MAHDTPSAGLRASERQCIHERRRYRSRRNGGARPEGRAGRLCRRWQTRIRHGMGRINRTSGYADFVTDKTFLQLLHADPFRHWCPDELIEIGLGRR